MLDPLEDSRELDRLEVVKGDAGTEPMGAQHLAEEETPTGEHMSLGDEDGGKGEEVM